MKKFTKLFSESLNIFRKHLILLLSVAFLLSFVPAALLGLSYTLYYGDQPPGSITAPQVVIALIIWVFSVALTLSVLHFLHVKRTKGKTLVAHESIKAGMKRFEEGILLTIIMFVALGILFALLIIPGIIFSVYWSFAYYALIEGKNPWKSLKYSKKLVEGKWWKVFGYIVLLAAGIFLVSLLALLPLSLLAVTIGYMDILAGVIIAVVIESAVQALMAVFVLIFLERMYVSLKGKR